MTTLPPLPADHVLRVPTFRSLLAAVTVNALGNGVAPVALAFAVLDLGGDAAELGLVVGVYALAEVLAVLLGGVLGDRVSRPLMLRGTMTGAALVQGLAAASLVGGWSSVSLLAVTGALLGALGALGNPSSAALTQQTVSASQLRQAVVWRRVGQNLAVVVGSGAAGVLVAAQGSGWALAVDAATFLVAGACFALVRVPSAPAPVREGLLGEVAAGFREVRRHTWLWLLILQALLYHLFYGGAQGVLGPIVVGDSLGRAAWGWALATMMAGFVAGGLLTLRWRPRHALHVGVWFLALTAAFPAAMAVGDSLPLLLAGAFVHGLGLEVFSVGWDLSIQENVAPHLLSRVYSFDLVGSFVARPVGLALTGPVATVVGYDTWLLVVAAVVVGSVLVALTSPTVRRLERRAGEGRVDEADPGRDEAPVLADRGSDGVSDGT